jgi:hypothetical protein
MSNLKDHLPMMIVNSIPHRLQRYDSVGDWYDSSGVMHFSVSHMTPDMEMETLLHEMFEWYLCQKAGITAKMVDDWDFSHPDAEDPGSLPGCPYRKQHMAATKISRLAVKLMGHKWSDYDNLYNDIADKLSEQRSEK